MLLMILKIIALVIILILLLLLAVFLLILLVPFHFTGKAKNTKGFEAEINVSWLLNIIGVSSVFSAEKKLIFLRLFGFNLFTHKIKPKPEKKPKKEVEKEVVTEKKKKKTKPSPSGVLDKFTSSMQTISLNIIKPILRFVLGMLSSLKLKVTGEAEVGLADPADTGILLGAFYATCGALQINNFKLYPNWEEMTLIGETAFHGRAWLIDILRIVVKTVFSSPIRRIWWPLLKEKLRISGKIKKPQTV